METKKQSGSFFKVMYRTRIRIRRGDMPILNLSLMFSLSALRT